MRQRGLAIEAGRKIAESGRERDGREKTEMHAIVSIMWTDWPLSEDCWKYVL